jgi:hypothetical protein
VVALVRRSLRGALAAGSASRQLGLRAVGDASTATTVRASRRSGRALMTDPTRNQLRIPGRPVKEGCVRQVFVGSWYDVAWRDAQSGLERATT